MSPGHDGRPHREWCTTPDGLRLAVYDFGGQGPDLVLVHATGFCAEVLIPLARSLSSHYHCWGLDLRAHGHSDRPADGNFSWSGFKTDVLAAIDHFGLSEPLAFGHSCGGAAILLAEQSRPGTFRSLYCFEPVVLPEPPPSPGSPAADQNPLSAGARRRRETFPSGEEALVNFSSKPPLGDLDPEVLELYVAAGFEPVPPGKGGDGRSIRLRCRRDDEAAIYAQGFFHGAFEHLGEVHCPVSLCCGQDTDAFPARFLRADAERLPRATVEVLPDIGHFGPLQQPGTVARSVEQSFSTLAGTPPP